MIVAKFIAIAVISYLLGSLNFSIIVSRALAKRDIREAGSGNAGATNMLRTYGKKFAVFTMIGDIIKVAVAILIAFLLLGAPLELVFKFADTKEAVVTIIQYKEVAGFFCVLGHIFPLYFKFKGGKGVAACTGMVILVDWRIALILFVIFVLVVLISKMISLGSITIAVFYPLLIAVFYQNLILFLIAVMFAAIVIVAHRKNIRRIVKGTENKISDKKSK